MRIHFNNLGHAERCLKICADVLSFDLIFRQEARLPAQRLRNALSRGFGYSSYHELQSSFLCRETALPLPSDGVMLEALTKSFDFGVKVAKESDISIYKEESFISRRLAREALQRLKVYAPTRSAERFPSLPHGTFYKVQIEGQVFSASLSSDGPYLSHSSDGVALGVCSIVPLSPLPSPLWAVVKYEHEIRINLQMLSASGIHELSSCFGIPICREVLSGREDRGDLFFQSTAFKALIEWTRKHSRLAKRITDEYGLYIPSLAAEIENITIRNQQLINS